MIIDRSETMDSMTGDFLTVDILFDVVPKAMFEILIVDDVKDNLLALSALLERDDVRVHQALSGTLGLELMMKHDFCLALLDVRMPGMSGFELAELMRGSNKTKNIPIIFVTATAKEQNFSFEGYESGAVDFLLKPLDPHAVKSKVNIFIELYQQKKELKTAEAKFRGLLETAPDAIVIVDDEGRIELVNKRTEAIFGYDRAEMMNQPIEMLMPLRFHRKYAEYRVAYSVDPSSRPMGLGLDLYGRRKDESEFPVEISSSPLKTENGTLTSIAIRDVSQRFALEKEQKELLIKFQEIQVELEKTVLSAERANASKTQFLANMSHEIRTPIGVILGFTDLMKCPSNTPAENAEYMTIVDRNSMQLLRLIDDILDLTKVEAGMMMIENIEFSLLEMLADFNSTMRLKAETTEIEFQLIVDTLIPNVICSDPGRVRQVLNNLVGNALKFTSQGSVTLRVAFSDPVLSFQVQDTGLGISKEQEAKLFKPFVQADVSTTRKFGGSGLGLVLSRKLSEVLGGKLELIASAQNVGSTFLFEMNSPLLSQANLVGKNDLVTDSTIAGLSKKSLLLSDLRVLLVEDSLDNQALLKRYLDKAGAKVTTVSDGAQAVTTALSQEFDVLLMDIQMPVLDGHEATKKLRLGKYPKPIVALTAHAMKEEKQRCFESGFNEYLSKPIESEKLLQVMSRFMPELVP
jgi:PAS domain S-box-containing protein